jgi:hypothetical protein
VIAHGFGGLNGLTQITYSFGNKKSCHDPSDSEQAKQFHKFSRIITLKLRKKLVEICVICGKQKIRGAIYYKLIALCCALLAIAASIICITFTPSCAVTGSGVLFAMES